MSSPTRPHPPGACERISGNPYMSGSSHARLSIERCELLDASVCELVLPERSWAHRASMHVRHEIAFSSGVRLCAGEATGVPIAAPHRQCFACKRVLQKAAECRPFAEIPRVTHISTRSSPRKSSQLAPPSIHHAPIANPISHTWCM